MNKKVLIACDSFKNSFSSLELAKVIENQIHTDEKLSLAVADGGEGTLEAILFQDPTLRKIGCKVNDPLFRNHKVYFLFDQNNHIAYISLADTCGFQHLSKNELDPWKTSTYGFGQCIQQAMNLDAKTIYLFLGSSCTNDAGVGMAEALGYRFYSKEKKELQSITPTQFNEINSIDQPIDLESISQCTFICVTDVTNPLLGPNGATLVYSKQKGADSKTIPYLEKQIHHVANKIASISKITPENPGAGSAGGLGFGCMAFLHASNISGARFMIDLLEVEDKVKKADIVLTGEGMIDSQTFNGKWVQSIAQLAKKHQKSCVAICAYCQLDGTEIKEIPIDRVFSLYDQLPSQIDIVESREKLNQVILEINDYIVHLK